VLRKKQVTIHNNFNSSHQRFERKTNSPTNPLLSTKVTMRPQAILFLVMVAQPAATASLKGAPIHRALESNLPEAAVAKIIGAMPSQFGEFPYFVDMNGMCVLFVPKLCV
jgi:hypothetical protein